MVKFLSGNSFDGERVPVCTYWRSDVTTDKDVDFAPLKGTGASFSASREGGSPLEGDPLSRSLGARGTTAGTCIANAFFAREDITCFNEGNCNGTGQCVVCSKYRFEGLQLGITHSPPLDFLKQFLKGVSDADLKSPNLIKAVGSPILTVENDQLPFHILLRNIMARIAKCCNWSQGDGSPGEFFLAPIVDGPDSREITDVNGQKQTVKGISVTHPAFPDTVGAFFPVGTVVVAGFLDNPSFYLEPRTGLVKDARGVLWASSTGSVFASNTKSIAVSATRPIISTVNFILQICEDSKLALQVAQGEFDSATLLGESTIISAAQQKLDLAIQNNQVACDNATQATQLGDQANDEIGVIVTTDSSESLETFADLASDLSQSLESLAALGESSANVGGGSPSAALVAATSAELRKISQQLSQATSSGRTKCRFFFEESNVAAQWNSPEDGTIPCNGVRTDCKFYTGAPWIFATEEKLSPGQMIKAEAVQEIRFRSADWTQFDNPEEEFESRFSTPFIWAFKQYIDVPFIPDPEDLLLYKPKVLFDDTENPVFTNSFQTIQVEKVEVADFEDFALSKSTSRIEPGSEDLDRRTSTSFPTLISEISVPTIAKLRITHPRTEAPFVYRMWKPTQNKIALFGEATPFAKVVLVNQTALQERDRFLAQFGERNITPNIPKDIPGAPLFTDTSTGVILEEQVFAPLRAEKSVNDSSIPLGFDEVESDSTGSWSSLTSVDLIPNQLNRIYAFVIQGDGSFLVNHVDVDARLLHSLPIQSSFKGVDFTMQSFPSSDALGPNSEDTVKEATLTAESRQILGSEPLSLAYGYHAWRFVDRGLKVNDLLTLSEDVAALSSVSDPISNALVTTDVDSSLVTSVTYEVVQYRKTGIEIEDWYPVNECGFIMIRISDPTANRVLPLPDQAGQVKALTNVLVNGGGKGSIVAQFALEEAWMVVDGERKNLVQTYRHPDGLGLPANYVLLGPSTEVENAFGRLVPGRDQVFITYTYLQAQDTAIDGTLLDPVNPDEIVTRNFYGDNFRAGRSSRGTFSVEGSLTVGGVAKDAADPKDTSLPIRREQQDWCFVYADSEGRPIGRRVARFMVLYSALACINVELFYSWVGSCQVYALAPDLGLAIGEPGGTLLTAPKGTTDPNDPNLTLGSRIANLIGDNFPCSRIPHCGDHEVVRLGPLRQEFEVIVSDDSDDSNQQAADAGTASKETAFRAVFPSAGQAIDGEIVSTFAPGTQFLKPRGPLWYPYTQCERPRYDFLTNGPAGTNSTELVNVERVSPGINPTTAIPSTGQITGSPGQFGRLPRQDLEAYHGPDRVTPKILDVHPSLRTCTSAFTYGNQVLKGSSVSFDGAARRRGEIDLFWYAGLNWTPPPFGNFGRPRLTLEVAEKIGDFLAGANGQTVGFRWMPMFPEREDLGFVNGELFTEEVEPVHVYLTAQSSPLGSLVEVVDESKRFKHKELIQNVVGGGVEYPKIGYWPSFLPDASLGKPPTKKREEGRITTQWAWREPEKPIRRGVNGVLLNGLQLRSPDYFLDNRQLETQLRPDEGIYQLSWIPPRYDALGKLLVPGELRLADGPPRLFQIDFVNESMVIDAEEDSVYDTTKRLGDDPPFTCIDGTQPDNPRIESSCACEESPLNPDRLPARFLHLDEVSPDVGFASLYASEELETPFTLDLQRSSSDDPCCVCVYYIRGLFMRAALNSLPFSKTIDPVHSSEVGMSYTWSRPPHGVVGLSSEGRSGVDGDFGAIEELFDDFLDVRSGLVFFRDRNITSTSELRVSTDLSAGFPGASLANSLKSSEILTVKEFKSPNSPLFGGLPAENGISIGQSEPIVLSMRFSEYVRINKVDITFFAGQGWEVPSVSLRRVAPAALVQNPDATPGLRSAEVLATNDLNAKGTDVPGASDLNTQAIAQGLPSGVGAAFLKRLVPNYSTTTIFQQYSREFQLVFDARDPGFSMGIAKIEVEVEISSPATEEIEVFERRYVISTDSSGATLVNPEEKLQGQDSATGYWRTTTLEAITGHNRFRAYAWGPKLLDGDENTNPPIRGNAEQLEQLQEQEYDKARDLMPRPYRYTYQSFFPSFVSDLITFYGGTVPQFSTILEADISPVDQVLKQGIGPPLYGVIPKDRAPWHAPGHTWTFDLESNFQFCCFPCPKAMVIAYRFAHLHDGLEPVETARFWDELPSGFSKVYGSTMLSPDPTFTRGTNLGFGPSGGQTGSSAILDASLFKDIPPEVLENAGFFIDEDGNISIKVQGGE